MLSRSHVIQALQQKRSAFALYEESNSQEMELYRQALEALQGLSREQILTQLEHVPRPGALPTDERVAGQSVVRPFRHRWPHHRAAREWAHDVLEGIITYAVDGSQIAPSHDFSVPVGAVQIGWFENRHTGVEDYVKNIAFEVLPPDELQALAEEGGLFSDQAVNLRRFERECRQLISYMRRSAGCQPPPVCFLDGSMAISFAAHLHPRLQRRYLESTRSLLATSRETGVPLVGYVATSYANDLTNMLRWLRLQARPPRVADAPLLRTGMAWGDRTEAFRCAREDGLFEEDFEELDFYPELLFLYLKTTAQHAPARLELPAWLLEGQLLDWVIDVVRAECVVGTGYPYAVETADAVAVITAKDRQRFYRLFQDFLAEDGLRLRHSPKSHSKQERR